jgi:hypothetical protein
LPPGWLFLGAEKDITKALDEGLLIIIFVSAFAPLFFMCAPNMIFLAVPPRRFTGDKSGMSLDPKPVANYDNASSMCICSFFLI